MSDKTWHARECDEKQNEQQEAADQDVVYSQVYHTEQVEVWIATIVWFLQRNRTHIWLVDRDYPVVAETEPIYVFIQLSRINKLST